MCDVMSGTNDRLVKVLVFQPGEFTVFQSKFKAVASIKSFVEALEPAFESRLSNKVNYTLSDNYKDREKQKNQECSCCPFSDSVLQKTRTTRVYRRREN